MLEVILILRMPLLLQLAGVPVAVHRYGLGAPVRPNAELGITKPVRTMILSQRLQGRLKRAWRNRQRTGRTGVFGRGTECQAKQNERKGRCGSHIDQVDCAALLCPKVLGRIQSPLSSAQERFDFTGRESAFDIRIENSAWSTMIAFLISVTLVALGLVGQPAAPSPDHFCGAKRNLSSGAIDEITAKSAEENSSCQ